MFFVAMSVSMNTLIIWVRKETLFVIALAIYPKKHMRKSLPTDAELTYCVLCVPSISFACFGDDYSVSYDCGNGYVVFANPKIAEALKAENDRTDWKKYIYYL